MNQGPKKEKKKRTVFVSTKIIIKYLQVSFKIITSSALKSPQFSISRLIDLCETQCNTVHQILAHSSGSKNVNVIVMQGYIRPDSELYIIVLDVALDPVRYIY